MQEYRVPFCHTRGAQSASSEEEEEEDNDDEENGEEGPITATIRQRHFEEIVHLK